MSSPSFSFIAGDRGSWEVASTVCNVGQELEPAPYMDVRNGYLMKVPVDFRWLLRGVSSHARPKAITYSDPAMLPMPQFGRNQATCAAFIALKKTDAWWSMSDEEKLALTGTNQNFHRNSHTVASQFHDSRGLEEPFDHLTWFEYPPEDSKVVDMLLSSFRESEEWKYVEREIDWRLVKRSA